MSLFSSSEMSRRLKNIRQSMSDNGVDAIVINSVHNTLYYSGFWMVPWGRYQGVVIPLEGDPAVIAPRIEFDRPHRMSIYDDVRIYWDTQSSVEGIVDIIKNVLSDRGIEMELLDLKKLLPLMNFIKN